MCQRYTLIVIFFYLLLDWVYSVRLNKMQLKYCSNLYILYMTNIRIRIHVSQQYFRQLLWNTLVALCRKRQKTTTTTFGCEQVNKFLDFDMCWHGIAIWFCFANRCKHFIFYKSCDIHTTYMLNDSGCGGMVTEHWFCCTF